MRFAVTSLIIIVSHIPLTVNFLECSRKIDQTHGFSKRWSLEIAPCNMRTSLIMQKCPKLVTIHYSWEGVG